MPSNNNKIVVRPPGGDHFKGDELKGAFVAVIPWSIVCVDITTLPCKINKMDHLKPQLMVFVDIATGRVLTYCLQSTITATSVKLAVQGLLAVRPPAIKGMLMHSDRGGQFASGQLQDFVRKENNLLWSMTEPYRPQGNGVVERHFRSLKSQCSQVWSEVLEGKGTTLPENFGSIAELRETIHKFYGVYNDKHKQRRRGGLSPNQMEVALFAYNKVSPWTRPALTSYRNPLSPEQKECSQAMIKHINDAIEHFIACSEFITIVDGPAGDGFGPRHAPGPAGLVLSNTEETNGISPEVSLKIAAIQGQYASIVEVLKLLNANQAHLANILSGTTKAVNRRIDSVEKVSNEALAGVHQLEDVVTKLINSKLKRRKHRELQGVPRTEFTTRMMEALVAFANGPTASISQTRNCLALLVVSATGCRINEIRTLTHGELSNLISTERTEIFASKQNKVLIKAISTRHADMIYFVYQQLLAYAGVFHIDTQSESPIFVSIRTHKLLNPKVFMQEVNKWCKVLSARDATTFEGYLRSHSGRVGFACRLLRATDNLVVVKEALGHEDIRSTSAYIRTKAEDIKKAVDKAADLD